MFNAYKSKISVTQAIVLNRESLPKILEELGDKALFSNNLLTISGKTRMATASWGDYIVKNFDEYYVIKPEFFNQIFEEIPSIENYQISGC